MCRRAALAAGLLLTGPTAIPAHDRVQPGQAWQAWNWDPLVLLVLGLLACFYLRGLARLWRGGGRTVRRWQAGAFLGALAVLFLALVSPLDALSAELSAAHMVQHMLLMTAAAPLFVLGAPTLVLAWGLTERSQGKTRLVAPGVFRLLQAPLLWQPVFLWLLYAGVLWAWHHPVAYQAALRDSLVHDVQHLSFFLAACFFWRAVLDPLGRRRLHPTAALPYLFATSVQAAALGVFLTLSPRVWYGDYTERTPAWGLTPLADQQLAGLIMWMPACLIYPAAAALLFGAWLAAAEQPKLPDPRAQRCQPAAGR